MNNHLWIPLGIMIAIAAGIVFAPQHAGLLLMFSLLVFGVLALVWKDSKARIACLGALVLLSILNIGVNGMKFGIDFVGGTRIPVILEKSVDEKTMGQLISIIKTRASVLGLTEVKVKAIGDSEINVEIPSSDEEQIAFIESVLSHQGVYLAAVDGKVALKGEDIYAHSIRKMTSQQLGGNDWGVGFSITQDAAEHFADVALGKANYPVYMFLDREENAVVFLTKQELMKNAPESADYTVLVGSLNDAIKLEGSTLSFYIIDESGTISSNINIVNESNWASGINGTNITTTHYKWAIISKTMDNKTKNSLVSLGFVLKEREADDMPPEIRELGGGKLVVSKWKAIGLLDAPTLSASITTGKVSRDYSIGGGVPQGKSAAEKQKIMEENSKNIESILKGGALPVSISLGSATRIPASLGSEFLKLSLIGIAAALVAVAIFVGIRYKHLKVIAAILAISISEFIVLSAILGSFTIDLAGVAGIIASIGVGVDAQIVITDELLKKHLAFTERLEHAFEIIKMNVIVAVVAMVPLLFSGLVEIIGFAIATIVGMLLGFMLSRPAYGVLAEKILEGDEK